MFACELRWIVLVVGLSVDLLVGVCFCFVLLFLLVAFVLFVFGLTFMTAR